MQGMHTQAPANRLRELRIDRGVSLKQIAAACDVYPSTVWRWEERDIPRQYLGTVAALLGVTVPYLDGWENSDGEAA